MNYIDLHCDTLLEGAEALLKGEDFSMVSNNGDIDLGKMESAGYAIQFFAMFVPNEEAATKFMETETFDQAALYESMLAIFNETCAAHPDRLAQAKSTSDIESNRAAGRISGILAIEGSDWMKGDTDVLHTTYEQGVRLITLTWNFENAVGYPNSEKPEEMARGLKPRGIDFIREMNRLGMIVDVSHLSDGGFWDCLEHSSTPVIASHSNARAVCDHPRNLTDEMLRALADQGGVTGLNFCPAFLRTGEDLYGKGTSRIEDMVANAKHIVKTAGIETLALGSDFDGFQGTNELKDASEMPKLMQALESEGFTSHDLEYIAEKNALRVIREIL